jgi:serine/threonine protein kinase
MNRIILFSLILFCSFKAFASEDPSSICSPNGCYTVIQKLGEGAFGKVYAVENTDGQSFAIKTYKNPMGSSYSFSFYTDAEREFSRGQMLDHPNILKSHDFFMSEDDVAHIVLDLVNGQTLYETDRGMIDASHLQETVMQFIDALRYALAMELMHLDLHGGNIMLDNDSNVMIIDLASFFTLEEVEAFLYSKLTSYTAYQTPAGDEEPSILPLEPLRVAKLEKFFYDHPDVLQQITQVFTEREALNSMKAKKTMEYSKNAAILATAKSPPKATYSTSIDFSPFEANYFDRITDICINLISKSKGNRDEKITMRTNIKKIAWNYEEDRNDGIHLPFATYLDQLLNTFRW